MMPVIHLPYFTKDIAGIGGTLKQRPEDFVVHELPSYQPTGEGEHVMFEIEKRGISTLDAIDTLSRTLKLSKKNFGYAGLKDTHAITRQWLTVSGTTPEAVGDAASDKIKMLYVDRHRNKLRVGHLTGNRFVVRVRDVDPMKVVTLTKALRQLAERGVPNYFGEQRFGRRNTNAELGAALLRGDDAAVLSTLLGRPDVSTDDVDAMRARQAFDAGEIAAALDAWPRRDRDERAVLVRLARGESKRSAIHAVPPPVRRLWISSLQSRAFNAVVAARIETLDGLLEGDIAFKHANGACFHVENLAAEKPRAAAFEISATGPLFGASMLRPTGRAAEVEAAGLSECGIPIEVPNESPDALPGSRRPLRIRPADLFAEAGADEHGNYIAVSFTLPPGAYATTLLRELMRNDAAVDGPVQTSPLVPSPGTPGEGIRSLPSSR